MADNSFSVDTDRLHEQMPYVQELAARFLSVGSNLQARLDALGECWGDDATGQEFLQHYADPKQQILRGLRDTGEVVNSTADGIQTMAVNFQRLEDQNVAATRTLDLGGKDGGPVSGTHESRPGTK